MQPTNHMLSRQLRLNEIHMLASSHIYFRRSQIILVYAVSDTTSHTNKPSLLRLLFFVLMSISHIQCVIIMYFRVHSFIDIRYVGGNKKGLIDPQ